MPKQICIVRFSYFKKQIAKLKQIKKWMETFVFFSEFQNGKHYKFAERENTIFLYVSFFTKCLQK